MTAYYNENNEYCVQWLRNLIDRALIPSGEVDDRSIVDVRGEDLNGFTQCHFFAGIAGWSLALKLANWPENRSVWTGSCPCQPFSQSGQRKGFSDERHLWPEFFRIIRECRPAAVFGEQVAGRDGQIWLDLVGGDLEKVDYAFTAVNMGAACVGAPHLRQRYYWVADTYSQRRNRIDTYLQRGGSHENSIEITGSGTALRLANNNKGLEGTAGTILLGEGYGSTGSDSTCGVGSPPSAQMGVPGCAWQPRTPWSDPDWIYCQDGKYRPVEPGTFPLANGVPCRVERIRAYGNAIVPQVAAEVIRAYLACRP